MATNVFNATASDVQIFKAGSAVVQIGASSKAIMTNVTISFTRQLSPIPVLGDRVVYTSQRPQGTIECEAIVTKDEDLLSNFCSGSSDCSNNAMTVKLSADYCTATGAGASTGNDSGGKSLSLTGVFCNSITFTAAGTSGYVSERFSAVFTGLSVS